MRTRLFSLSAAALLCAAPALARSAGAPSSATVSLDPATPRGDYIEARTAAVFAGACHYGGQVTTQGREAVVAWRFDGGRAGGVELAGVEIVAAVSAEANLNADGKRHSIVYVSRDVNEAQRKAAVELVRSRYAPLLGEVRSVRPVAIDFTKDKDGYAVAIPDVLDVEGSLVTDRCCKMELQVWYAPFGKGPGGRTAKLAQLGEKLGGGDVSQIEVSCNELFRYGERSLGPVWERVDENNGFVGRFAFAPRTQP